MTWHNVEQNTDEPCPWCGKTWMELRAGKVTGSAIPKIMANYGKAFGEPAKKYATNIIDRSRRRVPVILYCTQRRCLSGDSEIAQMNATLKKR